VDPFPPETLIGKEFLPERERDPVRTRRFKGEVRKRTGSGFLGKRNEKQYGKSKRRT